MDSYFGWNNSFAWNQEPYENFNANQVNQFFPDYQNSYLYSYSNPEPQYVQEFADEEEERVSKIMEAFMQFMQNTNQAISRLEIQVSQLATIINEQDMLINEQEIGEFEINLENYNGCENDNSKNYESTPKIDHVIVNESVEKVYEPKTPYLKRVISRTQSSDFEDQPIKVNMIKELSMIQENKNKITNDPVDFFLNHLDQNWDESEYLDIVNELLRSTEYKPTKLECTFAPILSYFQNVSEDYLAINSKHSCDKKFDYCKLPRPLKNSMKFTFICPFVLIFYSCICFRIYKICKYVHLFSFSPHFF